MVKYARKKSKKSIKRKIRRKKTRKRKIRKKYQRGKGKCQSRPSFDCNLPFPRIAPQLREKVHGGGHLDFRYNNTDLCMKKSTDINWTHCTNSSKLTVFIGTWVEDNLNKGWFGLNIPPRNTQERLLWDSDRRAKLAEVVENFRRTLYRNGYRGCCLKPEWIVHYEAKLAESARKRMEDEKGKEALKRDKEEIYSAMEALQKQGLHVDLSAIYAAIDKKNKGGGGGGGDEDDIPENPADWNAFSDG